MISLILAGALLAQDPTRVPLQVQIPEVAGAIADPSCGGFEGIARLSTCFATNVAAMEGQMDQYNAAFQQQGWVAADGSENVVIYVRRKDGGGCDAFQVLALASNSASPGPLTPTFFAFAAIPGDICRDPATAPAG